MSEGGPFRVALTFDAEHPDRPRHATDNAGRILDALLAADVRATFFVQGRWCLANPGLAGRIPAEGHLIGNHSHYHARLPLFSDAGLREDVLDAQEAIGSTLGIDPRPWFRCPFGAGHDDPRVLGTLSELGYRSVYHHVELEDWEPWRSGEDVARDALAGVDAHGDGAVVLLHTWPTGSADAVPVIVEGLRDRGASSVRIDELPIRDLP